jgi:hypothetical protein
MKNNNIDLYVVESEIAAIKVRLNFLEEKRKALANPFVGKSGAEIALALHSQTANGKDFVDIMSAEFWAEIKHHKIVKEAVKQILIQQTSAMVGEYWTYEERAHLIEELEVYFGEGVPVSRSVELHWNRTNVPFLIGRSTEGGLASSFPIFCD